MTCPVCDGEFISPPISRSLDKTAVMELAGAVHDGDLAHAALMLDIVFRDDVEVLEWIAQRRARTAP